MNPILDELEAEVEAVVGVVDSAISFINGTAARLEAAVAAALENGATAEQLAPISGEIAAMREKREALAAAIAANS